MRDRPVRRTVKTACAFAFALILVACAQPGKTQATDPRLEKASRSPTQNGWIPVHLEGSPSQIGFQHGYLLSEEIEDNLLAEKLLLEHDGRTWPYYRKVAEEVVWPHIEEEYRQELDGIADGLEAKGSDLDRWDIVALNAFIEMGYFDSWMDRSGNSGKIPRANAERCSAFVATGSYTTDGKVVIAHNNWSEYLSGVRWNVIFDIVPQNGHRILMDGMPGLIHSGDDFGINSAGILITETTISGFRGFDPNGVPEFVRARKAMQYASSIDDFVKIMKERNNGAYANNWLVADRNTSEVADLELGLKNVNLWRTKDGYFVGSNFPVDPKLAREETTFNLNDKGASANARHARWLQLMSENKGKINVAMAQTFLADHVDTFEKKEDPDERTLCGHIDLSPRGLPEWQKPYGPAGAVQNKAADAAMAADMSLMAALGHACARDFSADGFLRAHTEFGWQKPVLRDLKSYPWTKFQIVK